MRLELNCDVLLSIFALKFNLRHFNTGEAHQLPLWAPLLLPTAARQPTALPLGGSSVVAPGMAVVPGRGLHSSTLQLNLSRF